MPPAAAATAAATAPLPAPPSALLGPGSMGMGMPMPMPMPVPMLTHGMPARSQYMPLTASPPQASPSLGPLAPARAASFDVSAPSSSAAAFLPRSGWAAPGMTSMIRPSALSPPPPAPGQHQLFLPPSSIQAPASVMPAFSRPDARPLTPPGRPKQPVLDPSPPLLPQEPQGTLVGARLNWCDMICQTIAELADPHMVVQDLFLRMCYLFPEIREWAVGKDWEGKVKNRIKSTLSIKNAVFCKVPRPSHVPGKGAWWTLTPEVLAEWRTGKKAEAVRSLPTNIDTAQRRPNSASTVEAASTGGSARRDRKSRRSGTSHTVHVSRESSVQASSPLVNTSGSVSLPPQGLGFTTGVPGYKSFMTMASSPLMTESASLPPSVIPSPVASSTALDSSSPTVLALQFGPQSVPTSLSPPAPLPFLAPSQPTPAFTTGLPSMGMGWGHAPSKTEPILAHRPSGPLPTDATGTVTRPFPDFSPTSLTSSSGQSRGNPMKAEIDVIFGWSGNTETKSGQVTDARAWVETTPPLVQANVPLSQADNDLTTSPSPSDSSGASVQTSLEQPSGGAEMTDRSLLVLGLQPEFSFPSLDEANASKSFSSDFALPCSRLCLPSH